MDETCGAASNPRWPALITHRQGQDSNEDVAPLEQLNRTTLFLGQAEARESKWAVGGRRRRRENNCSRRRRDNLPSSCLALPLCQLMPLYLRADEREAQRLQDCAATVTLGGKQQKKKNLPQVLSPECSTEEWQGGLTFKTLKPKTPPWSWRDQ